MDHSKTELKPNIRRHSLTMAFRPKLSRSQMNEASAHYFFANPASSKKYDRISKILEIIFEMQDD